MHQWISSVNSYYYPYMIYHVTHERNGIPRLGIASDEKVVAHALPKVEVGLQVLERALAHGKDYLLGSDLTLADFYLVPCTFSFSLTHEGKAMYPKYPGFCRWRETMEALPTVKKLRACCRRAHRSSTLGSGPCRIGRNIDRIPIWGVSRRAKAGTFVAGRSGDLRFEWQRCTGRSGPRGLPQLFCSSREALIPCCRLESLERIKRWKAAKHGHHLMRKSQSRQRNDALQASTRASTYVPALGTFA